MPVSIRKFMTNLSSFPVTNILILQNGDKSTGINLCRKNYNVLQRVANGEKIDRDKKKSFLQSKMIQNQIDRKCSIKQKKFCLLSCGC